MVTWSQDMVVCEGAGWHGDHACWNGPNALWYGEQASSSEPIEKIFGPIDYVIDLNNLEKFGFGKIFWNRGTYTQNIRVRPFFSFFFFKFKKKTFYAL